MIAREFRNQVICNWKRLMNKSIKQNIQAGTCMLVLTLTACSQNGTEPSADETAVTGDQGITMQVSDSKVLANGESLEQQVSGAIADLANRFGIATNVIKVSQARVVTWGSSAVGCPKEGMSYTQAIVPGIQVLLEADGTVYRYHGRTGSKLFLCPEDRAQEPAYGPGKEFM